MGEHEGWSETGGGGLWPNGLLPSAGPLIECLDSERWFKAEERTAELIACIQPNQPSEERRNAVADYVQRLIMKCFPCQVFTFGSVPLKTYLPDGDIDLMTFSNNPNLKDSWASDVRDLLEAEEKNENAEFHLKEVQYIQAEVKIIKCLVENIVVDISFNQLGGLCTLCFLEEVDNLINQNHLFKRSIILIKAWCYYESRILGAHHGLISTYALETLVLYIFHVFNNSFTGPLEVLYRFLEFFSNFDWENFCVSLWGPVPISSLPDVTAEPPLKDSGELLLNKVFLDACSSVYAVFPGGQDNQGQTFLSKHFNVIDPLRVSNNLGRSVSKGNFFRIRSAFAFGAKRLARLLDCPKENLVSEVNQFFTNTWDRHGNGIRPDAQDIDTWRSKLSATDSHPDSENTKWTDSQQSYSNLNSPRMSLAVHSDIKNFKSNHLVNEIQRSPFARMPTSPELTDSYKDAHSWRNRAPESGKNSFVSDMHGGSNSYHRNMSQPQSGLSYVSEEIASTIGAQGMHQEEQDLVNMMASSGLHGFNGHIHMPMNLASGGHLPFPFSPSFLASMGYTQWNFAKTISTNIPALSGVPFSHDFVSPELSQYVSTMGVTLNSKDSFDPSKDITSSVEMSYGKSDWCEPDVSWSIGFENSEILLSDDRPQSSYTGLNYIPPPRRVGGSGGFVRSQQKHNKEKCGSSRNDHLDHFQHDDRANDVCSDEITSSRFFSAARSNSLRSKTLSESSWDETSTASKSNKENGGKKAVASTASMSDCVSVDNDHMTGYESAQMSGSDSMVSVAPMMLGSNSRQRTVDNSGFMPLTFYPTGPPVPFLTMLPFYNVQSETGSTDPSMSHFESLDNSDIGQNYYTESLEQVEDFSPSKGAVPGETADEHTSDILNSDFASHWQNLQFGRFCQTPPHHGPTVYPSRVMVPQVYLQGRVPWDGPGRPVSNMNLVTQFMSYGPRLVPVAPLQSASGRPNFYQRYVEDLPRYRIGTGTYLPNPKVSVRDSHFLGPRRVNYNYDRTDNHVDRDGNWTVNSKSQGSGRNHGHNRTQPDKSSSRLDQLATNDNHADRSMGPYRPEPFPMYQPENAPLHPGSGQSGPVSVTYGMYPIQSSIVSNGSTVPSVVMVYPYEHNTGFGSRTNHLEIGSVGPVGFPDLSEESQPTDGSHARGTIEERRFYGSSPDQP